MMLNRSRLIEHAAARRLQSPPGSRARKRWKLVLYALVYNAEWPALRRALAADRLTGA